MAVQVTLRQFQVFDGIVKQLHFIRAVEELHLSQPVVSLQTKLLGNSAGMRVYEVHGTKKDFLLWSI